MFHRSREQGAGSGRTRRALLPALSSLLLVLFGCSRDHRTPLVIYSPHGRDLLTLFERRFEALHPDIDVRYSNITLSLTTHDQGGITQKDVALAKQVEAIRKKAGVLA